MLIFIILFLLTAGGLIATVMIPEYFDYILYTAPMALVAFVLLLGTFGSRRRQKAQQERKPSRKRRRAKALDNQPKGPKRWAVVYGSHVMHWLEGKVSVGPVKQVLGQLRGRGFTPVVLFDASAGHKLFGHYMDDADLARALQISAASVFVVPKGATADPAILQIAQSRNAMVVSNDYFRDWVESHPIAADRDRFIRGKVSGEAVTIYARIWANGAKTSAA